jgi:hypothetical protein
MVLRHLSQRQIEEVVGLSGQKSLGQVIGLGEQKPMISPEGECFVDARPNLAGWHDRQRHERINASRMVQHQSIANPGAPIVPNDTEAAEAKLIHDRNLVACHGSFGIVRRRSLLWTTAFAVSTQIGRDDRIILGKNRRYAVPGNVGLGIAMQQQQRWPVASDEAGDSRLAGFNIVPLKLVEHDSTPKGFAGGCKRLSVGEIRGLHLRAH